jgi:hypothetical protein
MYTIKQLMTFVKHVTQTASGFVRMRIEERALKSIEKRMREAGEAERARVLEMSKLLRDAVSSESEVLKERQAQIENIISRQAGLPVDHIGSGSSSTVASENENGESENNNEAEIDMGKALAFLSAQKNAMQSQSGGNENDDGGKDMFDMMRQRASSDPEFARQMSAALFPGLHDAGALAKPSNDEIDALRQAMQDDGERMHERLMEVFGSDKKLARDKALMSVVERRSVLARDHSARRLDMLLESIDQGRLLEPSKGKENDGEEREKERVAEAAAETIEAAPVDDADVAKWTVTTEKYQEHLGLPNPLQVMRHIRSLTKRVEEGTMTEQEMLTSYDEYLEGIKRRAMQKIDAPRTEAGHVLDNFVSLYKSDDNTRDKAELDDGESPKDDTSELNVAGTDLRK